LDGKKEFNLTTGGIREGQGKSPFSLTFLIMDVPRIYRIAHPAGETVLRVEVTLDGGFSAMNVKTVLGEERRKVRLIF
jgi:hypothetical protein